MKLIRMDNGADAVFGVLTLNGEALCLTLERPDLDNRPNVSCIPAGVYVCERVQSSRFRGTFQIMNVSERSNILFHCGNTAADSRGCVVLGSEYGKLEDARAVLNSHKAFKKFMEALNGIDHFPLQIIEIQE